MPIVVRDFGTARPWSTQFSQQFGPDTTGIGADHNATVRCDFGAPTEWGSHVQFSDGNLTFLGETVLDFGMGRSTAPSSPIEWSAPLLQDVVFSSGVGRISRRDIVVPQEETGASGVTLNSSAAAEWGRGSGSNNSPIVAEWRGALTRDIVSPDETISPIIITNQTAPTEWGSHVQFSDGNLTFLGETVLDFGMVRSTASSSPIEWSATLLRDVAMPIEPEATVAFGASIPTEWMGNTIMATALTPIEFGARQSFDVMVPTETISSLLNDAVVPLEWGQPAQTAASVFVPTEFTNRIFEIATSQPEFGSGAAVSRVIPAEWTGPASATLDASGPVEWRGSFTKDDTVVTDWATAFTVDATAPIFWANVFATSNTVPADLVNVILGELIVIPDSGVEVRTVDIAMPQELLVVQRRDAVIPITFSGSVVGVTGDALIPLAFLGTPTSLTPALMDSGQQLSLDTVSRVDFLSFIFADLSNVAEMTLSTIGEASQVPETSNSLLTEDTGVQIYWLAPSVSASMTFSIQYESGTTSDSVSPVSWLSMSSYDMTTTIEFSHDTRSMTFDAEVPIDFLRVTVADVAVSIDRTFGRESVGSKLEPDEWEKIHEVPSDPSL